MSTPGYNSVKQDPFPVWINDLRYEKIFCVKCDQQMGYLHDPSGGEYNIDTLCRKCAKLIHYEKMGMFE